MPRQNKKSAQASQDASERKSQEEQNGEEVKQIPD